ncbi:MAG: PQQ-binding-like beta-propeller repeat protein [Hyphomicrobium sp.]
MPEQALSETSAKSAIGSVVAVGHAGCVLLIEVATGRVIWERALAEIRGASACDGQPVDVRLNASRVIAGAMGHVFALGLEDGSVLWHVDRRRRGDGATRLATERN